MLVVIVWILLGAVTAFAAYQKGRNVAGWFLFGFLIPPLALVMILLSSKAQNYDLQPAQAHQDFEPAPPASEKINALGGYVAWGLLVVGIIIVMLMMIET